MNFFFPKRCNFSPWQNPHRCPLKWTWWIGFQQPDFPVSFLQRFSLVSSIPKRPYENKLKCNKLECHLKISIKPLKQVSLFTIFDVFFSEQFQFSKTIDEFENYFLERIFTWPFFDSGVVWPWNDQFHGRRDERIPFNCNVVLQQNISNVHAVDVNDDL